MKQPAEPAANESYRPLASTNSQNFARFFGLETGTVSGTVSLLYLEPQAGEDEKTL
jgi:hypothetical protein